ncbi:MAG: HEPN domain-containing protein [Pseudomonadales bacterium]|nr:HEPN domain-containing protein [Pseudomonadales bacterium]
MSVLSQAEMFYDAYEVLQESNNAFVEAENAQSADSAEAKFGRCHTMQVEVVCLSFSVELYVKALHIAISDESPRGHDTLELFRKLPENVRDTLYTFPSVNKYGWSFSQFEDEIGAISKSFVKWRYSYEEDSLWFNTYFALVFIEALRFAIASACKYKAEAE